MMAGLAGCPSSGVLLVRAPARRHGHRAWLPTADTTNHHVLAAHSYAANEASIPWNEVIVVFDADMCANRDFFLKILEVLLDDSVALCLTPQVGGVGGGVRPATDRLAAACSLRCQPCSSAG